MHISHPPPPLPWAATNSERIQEISVSKDQGEYRYASYVCTVCRVQDAGMVRIHSARPLPLGAAYKYVPALDKFYPAEQQESQMQR